MVSPTQTGVVNLDERREQAKHALLTSLASAKQNPEGKQVIEELTQLLTQLEAPSGSGPASTQDGPLKDQNGLPVVEITEEVHDYDVPLPPRSAKINEYQRVKKLSKSARDRLLDLLEEEEQQWERRQRALEGNAEPPELVVEKTARGAPAPVPIPPSNDPAKPPVSNPKEAKTKSKTVSFADGSAPRKPDVGGEGGDWGDVIPATLKKKRKPLSQARSVMKYDVVERPTGSAAATLPNNATYDSDDDDGIEPLDDKDDDDDPERKPWVPDDTNERDFDILADDDEYEEGEDMDVAQLQREVALDYYSKRDTVFQSSEAQAVRVMSQHQEPDDPWNKEWVPLEASLASKPEKVAGSGSRFKNDIRPPHSVKLTALGSKMNTPVKEGKLVNGQLVAPADSESDDDGLGEYFNRMIGMLRDRKDSGEATPANKADAGAPLEQGIKPVEKKEPRRVAIGEVKERGSGSSIPAIKPSVPASATTATRTVPKASRFKASQATQDPPTSDLPPPKAGNESNQPPSVISSPSFPQVPRGSGFTSTIIASPSFPSSIIESPSFPPLTSDSRNANQYDPNKVVRRDVMERAPGSEKRSDPPKKVSRFKAQRL